MRCETTVSAIRLILSLLLAGAAVGCSDDETFHRGTTGESCRARNDCESGLACISEICAPESHNIEITGKSCYRVECGNDAECCTEFAPAPGCDLYEEACEADPSDCDAYQTLCVCNRGCVDELCEDAGPSCATDEECPGFSSPYCVESQCVECREHGDCLDEGARCVEGACQSPCENDEHCPLLHACDAGACVPAGCTTDRECVFVLDHPRGQCGDGVCFVGCEDDSGCDADAFEVCDDGQCIFVGCETDAECRAYLDLSETIDNVRAECR
ncbi:conserved hypothetical protein [Haliangium ochraceum DSM 14365]|uniref:Lipoprotein n=1 Tax=Haliangium ochraceum (strain DSM 14365 / JCM 11303 / SMP-2) TaxID=502025 RepID=D0LPT0_HALO1|nr:conserved hypothetical protein [Haliangium ochraceum DSM 14365]